MSYEPDNGDDIFDETADRLLNIEPDANPRADSTLLYATLQTIAQTLAANQEQDLETVYNSAYIEDATGTELTKKARNLGFIRDEPVKATGVVTFQRDNPASTDYTIPSGTLVETVTDDPVQFEVEQTQTLEGPKNPIDETVYSTTNTSYTAQTTLSVDASYRDTIDVTSEIRTTDGTYTASIEVADVTNNTTIATHSTTSTTFVSNTDSYDVSSISGTVEIEYRLQINDSAATAELQNATLSVIGQTGTDATVSAVDGGSDGNVGAGAIQAMPSPPTGVTSVINDRATGDPTKTDLSGDPLVAGKDEETDEELRQRVLDTDAIREGPDSDGVKFALENIDGVLSVYMKTNQEASTVDGIDPYHSELIVYGGAVRDIVEKLAEVMSVPTLLRLQGGVHGTKETYDLELSLLEQTETIPISRPTRLTATLDIDVVHTDIYEGDAAVKNEIVEYIGGTKTDNSSAVGTLSGENVLINEIENRVEDVDGVDYADVTLVDTDGDGVDDTTTDADGVPVLAVAEAEVARVDADMITVNTTSR